MRYRSLCRTIWPTRGEHDDRHCRGVTYLNSAALALILTLTAAARVSAQSNSQWQSLLGPASEAATAITTGKPRAVVMEAVSRLGNAQASLPGVRPQQCLDMMQDAASNYCLASEAWCKPGYRAQAAQRARDSLACYRGEKVGAEPVEPASSSDERLREAQQAGIDRYTKVHPDQPRVGEVPGESYRPGGRAPQAGLAKNPCANINLPGCNNGLR